MKFSITCYTANTFKDSNYRLIWRRKNFHNVLNQIFLWFLKLSKDYKNLQNSGCNSVFHFHLLGLTSLMQASLHQPDHDILLSPCTPYSSRPPWLPTSCALWGMSCPRSPLLLGGAFPDNSRQFIALYKALLRWETRSGSSAYHPAWHIVGARKHWLKHSVIVEFSILFKNRIVRYHNYFVLSLHLPLHSGNSVQLPWAVQVIVSFPNIAYCGKHSKTALSP